MKKPIEPLERREILLREAHEVLRLKLNEIIHAMDRRCK